MANGSYCGVSNNTSSGLRSRFGGIKSSAQVGIFLVALGLMLAGFWIDRTIPMGNRLWPCYFGALFLSLPAGSRIFPYLVAGASSVLVLWGWYLVLPGSGSQTFHWGRIIGIVVLWMGAALLSEQARKERKWLAQMELNNRVLADQLDAVSRFTVDGTLVYVNDSYCRYFGKKREELIGHPWQAQAVAGELPMIQERLRSLSPTRPAMVSENQVNDQSGGVRWMQFVNHGIFDADGRLTEVQSVGRDVTDRRRAEEMLRESEQRFRELAESIQEIFWLYDLDQNRIIYISPNYDTLWGRPAAALYADPFDWVKAIHPDDHERVMAAVKKQTEGGYDEEFRILMPDGRIGWTRGRAFPVCDDSGRVRRIAGVHEDITRRKQLNEAFQRSQENYRKLAESSPDAIFIFDHDLRISYANRSAAAWLGKFPAELTGHVCADFFPADIAREYELSLRAVLHSRKPLQRERKTVIRDDERIIETRLLPLTDQRGETTSVMGISRDMTDQRRTEESLRESEEWSRKLIGNMREGFFRVDLAGRILDVNDAYCRMSGYAREELLRMSVSDISLTDKTSEEVSRRIEKVVLAGSERFETRHRCKGGAIMDVETVLTVLDVPDAQVLALMRDITERKQLELEVVRISADERQRIGFDLHDGLGQHLAGVAFKTKVLADALAAVSSPETGNARELVALVNQAISQTRGLARALAPVEVEVNGLGPALQNLAQESELNFRVSCRCDLAAANGMIRAEVGPIFYRIAQEAINNAIRHGGATAIKIKLETDGNQGSWLVIIDNGKGFEPEARRANGMGLRIMKYRAGAIGGQLSISSRLGVGTEVRCWAGTLA